MDTLIDNRIFPQEMQEKPKELPQKKAPKKSGIIAIVTTIALMALAGILVYMIMSRKDNITTPEPEVRNVIPTEYNEIQAYAVEKAQEGNPEMTPQERNAKINAFFGN